MADQPTLKTDRLVLRPWTPADRAPFAALNADLEVMRFIGRPMDRQTSDLLADRIEAHFGDHGFGLWAVEEPGVCAFAGFVGLSRPQFEAHFTPCVEVGWRLARETWARGYATEAAKRALAFGFETLNLPEIVSFTVPMNTRSRAVMERLGLVRDPAGDFDHPGVPETSPLRPHVLYRLTKTAYSAPRSAPGSTPISSPIK